MSSAWHPKKAISKGPGISKPKKPNTPSCSPSTTNATTTNYPVQTPLDFNVEEITGKRYVNGRVEMQVKWEGFPPEMSSWEPLENLGKCIVMVADFEAKLNRMQMQEKASRTSDSPVSSGSKKKVVKEFNASKASPAPTPGERKLAAAKPSGPKSNAKQSMPNPDAGLGIGGNQKEKIPIKLRPALNRHFSDDEAPSSSFGKWANRTPAEREISTRAPSPSALSESSISSGSSSQLLSELRTSNATQKANLQSLAKMNMSKVGAPIISQMKPPPQAKAVNKNKNSISATPENSINKAIHGIQIAEKCPEVQASKKSQKSKKNAKKIQKHDDELDSSLMTPCKTVFGLARGLELEKVVHSFKVGDRHFLFVTWKGLAAVDTVPIEDLMEAYPAQVLEYFEKIKHR